MTQAFNNLETSLEPRPPGCIVPLTAQQRRLWNDPVRRRGGWRHCATSMRVRGPLNVEHLRTSINTLAQRHESLRTRFVVTDGIPRQEIDPERKEQLEFVDLSGMSGSKVEMDASRLAQEFAERQIDWSIGPQFDVQVIKLSDQEHLLVATLDHMIADGASHLVVNREMWSLYGQSAQGVALSLPRLPIQFPDYSVWHQQTYQEWRAEHELQWREHLSGISPVFIPEDKRLNPTMPPVSAVHFTLGKKLSAKLVALASRLRVRLPLLMLAIHTVVMSRWCERRDMVLTFVSHGRYRPELTEMVGYISNLLPFRVEVNGSETFLDLMERINKEFRWVYQHRDLERVPDLIPECVSEVFFDWLPSAEDYRWLPLNSTYNLLRFPATGDNGKGCDALSVEPYPLRPFWPWCKFAPLFYEHSGEVHVHATYRRDQLTSGTIEQFSRQLRTLTAGFVRNPHARIESVR